MYILNMPIIIAFFHNLGGFSHFHTLGVVLINRHLQRSSVVVAIFEISIDVVITEELRHDGGVVVGCCKVQCGVVAAVLNIQINPLMVH